MDCPCWSIRCLQNTNVTIGINSNSLSTVMTYKSANEHFLRQGEWNDFLTSSSRISQWRQVYNVMKTVCCYTLLVIQHRGVWRSKILGLGRSRAYYIGFVAQSLIPWKVTKKNTQKNNNNNKNKQKNTHKKNQTTTNKQTIQNKTSCGFTILRPMDLYISHGSFAHKPIINNNTGDSGHMAHKIQLNCPNYNWLSKIRRVNHVKIGKIIDTLLSEVSEVYVKSNFRSANPKAVIT